MSYASTAVSVDLSYLNHLLVLIAPAIPCRHEMMAFALSAGVVSDSGPEFAGDNTDKTDSADETMTLILTPCRTQ